MMTIIIVFKEQLQNWFLRVVSVLFIMRANAWIFGLDAVVDIYMSYRLLDFKNDDSARYSVKWCSHCTKFSLGILLIICTVL